MIALHFLFILLIVIDYINVNNDPSVSSKDINEHLAVYCQFGNILYNTFQSVNLEKYYFHLQYWLTY